MKETIAFKISQKDYFKFNVIHNTKSKETKALHTEKK